MIKLLFAATFAALVLGAPAAFAQKERGPERAFSKLDKNDDGVVDSDEIKAPSARMFKRMDKNRDGVIDADEAKAFIERRKSKNEKAGERIEKRLKRADKDGDGKITESELNKAPRWFDKADADKDGKVTKAEIGDYADKRGKGRDRGKDRDDAKRDDAKKDDAAKGEEHKAHGAKADEPKPDAAKSDSSKPGAADDDDDMDDDDEE